MVDGVVRTFTKDMFKIFKKNQISIGTLDSLGYSYSAKDEVMKIAKGALVVRNVRKFTIYISYS